MNSLFLVTAQVNDEYRNIVWEGWGSVMLVVGGMVLTFGLVAILIWQIFRTRQATIENRATIAHEEAYRKLAEEATFSSEAVGFLAAVVILLAMSVPVLDLRLGFGDAGGRSEEDTTPVPWPTVWLQLPASLPPRLRLWSVCLAASFSG